MATKTGTILTLWGKTTPLYDAFTLTKMSSNKQWNYDDAAIIAGSFKVGIAYAIASAGSTDFTLIGAANNTPGTVFTATGVGTGTGTATVAGVTRFAQPLLTTEQISATYNISNGSPNVTLDFVVEKLYLEGTGPDYDQTVEYYRVLARDAINSAFPGVTLT